MDRYGTHSKPRQEAGCLRNLRDPDQFGQVGIGPRRRLDLPTASLLFYDHLFAIVFAAAFYRPSENHERVTNRGLVTTGFVPQGSDRCGITV